MCRFNDIENLRACDFRDEGEYVTVNFRSSKNDQLHMGNTNVLPYAGKDYCPASLVRLFFERMGLKFVPDGYLDENFVLCRVRSVSTHTVTGF